MNRCCCLALACLISVGGGCTSAPVRYYTLAPPPGETSGHPNMSFAIDVRVVHIPAQLNRAGLMVRTGPTEVTLRENERWASPVKEEIRDALRRQLQSRLDRMSGLRPDIRKLAIDIDVQRFEAELGREAIVEAFWSLKVTGARPGSDEAASTCTFRADRKIAPGYAGMVEGYQREIAALADAVVAELTRHTSGIDASCRQTSGSLDSPTRG
jgi:hypothetical protein